MPSKAPLPTEAPASPRVTMVVAEEGMVPHRPWRLRESNRHPGRFYFFNPSTRESQWTLPDYLIHAATDAEETESANQFQQSLAAAQQKVASMQQVYSNDPEKKASVITLEGQSIDLNSLTIDSKKSATTRKSHQRQSIDQVLRDVSVDLQQHLTSASKRTSNLLDFGGLQASSELIPSARKQQQPHMGEVVSEEAFKAIVEGRMGLEGSWTQPGMALDCEDFPYEVVQGLGQGGYSSVLLVRNMDTKELKALKAIPKKRINALRERARVQNELRGLTEIPPSPFLIRCNAAFESPTTVFLVMDYNSGGDLFFHLSQRIHAGHMGFTEPQARTFLAEIVVGLEHMHRHNFIHRDIKVENIMLDSRGHIKLVDFGLCRQIQSRVEPLSPTGSLAYMTPELLREHTGGRHTDWWAMGIVAYELMTGRSPWSSSTDNKVIRREIKSGQIPYPPNLSVDANELIRSLLHPDFRQRLGTRSSDEIRLASFFDPIDWELAEQQKLPPAVVIPKSAFTVEDCTQAMHTYISKNETPCDWTFGLPMINKNPDLRPMRKSRTRSKARHSGHSKHQTNNPIIHVAPVIANETAPVCEVKAEAVPVLQATGNIYAAEATNSSRSHRSRSSHRSQRPSHHRPSSSSSLSRPSYDNLSEHCAEVPRSRSRSNSPVSSSRRATRKAPPQQSSCRGLSASSLR